MSNRAKTLRSILLQLEAVLCDPEGAVSIAGSRGDQVEVQIALSRLAGVAAAEEVIEEAEGVTAAERWAAIETLMVLGDVTLEQRQDGGYGVMLEPVENIAAQDWSGDTPAQVVDAVAMKLRGG
jgi:hypothetical protein